MHTVTDYSTNRTLNVDHLRATAIAAEAAGFTAYNGGKDDGGSCNFDSAVLHLPTAWREDTADGRAALDSRKGRNAAWRDANLIPKARG